MNYKELIITLSDIHKSFQSQSLRAVNISLTLRNWSFGLYIVEFEQHGKDRAKYGESLLASIAKELKSLPVPNTDERELRRCRQFYFMYPMLIHAIRNQDLIRGTLSPVFQAKYFIPKLEIRDITFKLKLSYTDQTSLI